MKRIGQFYILLFLHHATYLWIVGSLGAAGVKVYSIIDERDYIVSHVPGHACCQRTLLTSGKRSVDVFAVGNFARVVEETVHVDNGHADNGAAGNAIEPGVEYAANDLHAVDLVAVHAGHECQCWSVFFSAIDVDGSFYLRLRGKSGY